MKVTLASFAALSPSGEEGNSLRHIHPLDVAVPPVFALGPVCVAPSAAERC